MKTLESYLKMLKTAGIAPDDYEVFETADGNLCLQFWETAHTMTEVLFTADGKLLGEKDINDWDFIK